MADRGEIDLVRDRSDILQVIAPYVALKRAGRVWKGLCPFHNEKTPSFNVDPDRKLWRCFGQCGEGGDVIKFLQKVENLTFGEALERLAIQAGVTLTPVRMERGARRSSEQNSANSGPQMSEKDRLYRAAECAARFYEEMLAKSEGARAYLQARGIGHEAQRQFRLGYAGEDWDALARFLAENRIALPDAITAGILAASEKGSYYDKLRGRIIFPILDAQERVIGFGGRLMEAVEGRPKYLNSAETPLFSKGRTLYGLWLARKAIAEAEQAIVVEGYMDVIAAHQAGIENVVAALGTALTEQHAQILGRFARRALLSFDADAAGMKAAQRAAHIFAGQEIETRMLELPEGEDPDSLLRAGRSADFFKAIETALPVAEYRLRKIVARPDLAKATETEKLAVFRREILPILRATKSVTEREHYIRLCAPLHPYYKDKDTLAEEQIRQELEGNRPGGAPWRSQGWVGARSGRRDYEEGYRKGKYRDETEFGQRTFGGPKYGNNPNSVINGKHGGTPPYGPIPIIVRTAEVVLLRALLGDDEELKRIITTGICPEHFPTLEYRALAEKQFAEVRLEPALDKPGEGEFDLESLRAKILLEPEIQVTEADVKKGIEDSVVCLKKWALRSRLIELRLKAVEGDDAAIAELPALEKQFRER